MPSLRDYLDRYARPGDDGLVFTGPNGALLRRSVHDTDDRQRTIAAAVSDLAQQKLGQRNTLPEEGSGT